MKSLKYISLIFCFYVASACQKDEIEPYKVEDSAICFLAASNTFSMRGNTEPTMTFSIPMTLIGPVTDYDRLIDVSVVDNAGNTAIQNQDFRILESVVKAGAISGHITIEVNALSDETESMHTRLQINKNEYFRIGYPDKASSLIEWSSDYARPTNEKVWRGWFSYICHGYSKNYHKVLIEALGEEIDFASLRKPTDDELEQGYFLKNIDWWLGASRTVVDYVENYDKNHPDAPLMHSDDYEVYKTYSVPVGEGTKPETIPTILETLQRY